MQEPLPQNGLSLVPAGSGRYGRSRMGARARVSLLPGRGPVGPDVRGLVHVLAWVRTPACGLPPGKLGGRENMRRFQIVFSRL